MLKCTTTQEEEPNERLVKGKNLAAFLIALFDVVPELSEYQRSESGTEVVRIDVKKLLSRPDRNPRMKLVEAKFKAAFLEMLSGFKDVFFNFPENHPIRVGSFDRASHYHARDIEDILAQFSERILDAASAGLGGLAGQLNAVTDCLELVSTEQICSLKDGAMGTTLILEPNATLINDSVQGEGVEDPSLNDESDDLQFSQAVEIAIQDATGPDHDVVEDEDEWSDLSSEDHEQDEGGNGNDGEGGKEGSTFSKKRKLADDKE